MIRILAACCLILAAVAASESIPADCRWMVSCDVQALGSSQAGAWIRSQLQRGAVDEGLAELESATGFDPRRDLRRIEVCAAADGESTGLMLLRGVFAGERLDNAIRYAQDHAAIGVGERTIHTWSDNGKGAAGCLAAPDLLILGRSAERIRQALASLDAAGAPPIALPADWTGSSLAVAAADGIDGLAARVPQFAMLRGLRSIAARLSGPADQLVLEVRAIAVGEAEAQQLADLAIGARAVLALMPPAGLDRALLDALRGGGLVRDGVRLDLRVVLPVAEARRLAEQMVGRGKEPQPERAPGF